MRPSRIDKPPRLFFAPHSARLGRLAAGLRPSAGSVAVRAQELPHVPPWRGQLDLRPPAGGLGTGLQSRDGLPRRVRNGIAEPARPVPFHEGEPSVPLLVVVLPA